MMNILPIETFIGFIVEIEFKKGNKIKGLLSKYKNKYAITNIESYKTILFNINNIRKNITIIEDIKTLFNKEIEVKKMSKELEALKHIYYSSQGYGETDKYYKYLKEYLEAIENAKPSEALNNLERIENYDNWSEFNCCLSHDFPKEYNTIKQTLIKAQEQENVIRILFEKNIRIYWIKSYSCVKSYNNGLPKKEQLTQEEFNTLKKYTNEQI